jgi:hypothetical protein
VRPPGTGTPASHRCAQCDDWAVNHCVGKDYVWIPNTIRGAPPRPIAGAAGHRKTFHAVAMEGDKPAAITVCSETPDEVDPRGDWQDPTLHEYSIEGRCPDFCVRTAGSDTWPARALKVMEKSCA